LSHGAIQPILESGSLIERTGKGHRERGINPFNIPLTNADIEELSCTMAKWMSTFIGSSKLNDSSVTPKIENPRYFAAARGLNRRKEG